MNHNTKPASAADEIKSVNNSANRQFNGDRPAPSAKLPEADDAVTKTNHQADAEFNVDRKGETLGNTVGGLRGPSD